MAIGQRSPAHHVDGGSSAEIFVGGEQPEPSMNAPFSQIAKRN
jgi:hypothetical protein